MDALSRRRSALLVGVLAFAAYASNLGNDFAMDDRYNVVENPHIRSFASIPAHFTQAWGGHVAGGLDEAINRSYWRPITATSWTVDYALFGAAPWGFHLVNNLLHALVSVMTVLWVLCLCADRRAALLAGLVFALHPLHSEAVHLVTYRTEVLAALFCVTALWWRAESRRGLVSWWPLLALYGLGLGSKEIAVTLPGWLFLQDWLQGRFVDGHGTLSGRKVRRHLPLYLGLCGVLVGYFVLRATLLSANPLPFFGALSAAQTSASVMKIHAFYVRMWFLPYPLNPFWDMSTLRPALSWLDPQALLGAGLLFGSVIYVATRLRPGQTRGGWVALGLATWWLGLLPVSHIVPIPVGAGERFTYLPSLGASLACGVALSFGVERSRGTTRRVSLALIALWCVMALGWTASRGLHWRDDQTLLQRVTHDLPHSFNGHHLLGQLHVKHGRCDEAIRSLEAAERALPGFAPNQPWLARARACAQRRPSP